MNIVKKTTFNEKVYNDVTRYLLLIYSEVKTYFIINSDHRLSGIAENFHIESEKYEKDNYEKY